MSIIARSITVTAGSPVQLLAIPTDTVNSLVSINLVNVSSVSRLVSVYISLAASPTPADAIEYQYTLEPGVPLTRSCGHILPSETIFVASDGAGVSARAAGLIEGAVA